MNTFFQQFNVWMRKAVSPKYHCNVYYENERIFSCKNHSEAEEHIKRMYNLAGKKESLLEQAHERISENKEDNNCWKKFRNRFKIAVDN